MRPSRAVVTLLVVALLTACSAYRITADRAPALLRPAEPLPVTVAVFFPDFESAERQKNSIWARQVEQDVYLDFARMLQDSGFFAKVVQTSGRVRDVTDPASNVLAILTPTSLDFTGAADKFFVDFLTTLTLGLLGPVMESHENVALSLKLEMLPPRDGGAATRIHRERHGNPERPDQCAPRAGRDRDRAGGRAERYRQAP